MDAASLAQLIDVSHAVGARPDLVQGGRGNTSVKSSDGKTMAVKASGTILACLAESAGWAELDLERLLAIFDLPDLAALEPAEREARVLAHQQACVVDGPASRPSVESALHALLGRVVVHTHPVAVNALTCGPGEAAMNALAPEAEPPPLWVPYTDPGYKLAVSIKARIDAYQTQHDAAPQVLFLENHGLFVSADSVDQALELHEAWYRRCEQYFEEAAPERKALPEPDAAAVREMMAQVRRAGHEKGRGLLFARLSDNPDLIDAAANPAVRSVMAAGALSPDQIVYTGARSAVADGPDDIGPALAAALDEPSPPRLLLVKDLGAVLVSDKPGGLELIETVAGCAARTIRLAAGRGGAHNLSPQSAEFIIHWEVEHYRSALLDADQKRLTGKVAVVTGAASGLGLGIALGLAKAGAAVALCDIDEASLAAAVETAGESVAALPVRMDVTDEAQVAAGFDRVVRNWGGVDIVVCAAGIAPPHLLVDMPVADWRRALDINLTGYFLAAREGARILQAQGGGGSMVMVSSKSGLEASKANSAYNATKAGELHLMRGWALELGEHGIRVNAVAPGNVFEGSKIWNPEYIKVCAAKKGIAPEEVIPHYVNLTALKREIKRGDVAAAVCFLCSEDARCITGQTLVIDGGQVMVR